MGSKLSRKACRNARGQLRVRTRFGTSLSAGHKGRKKPSPQCGAGTEKKGARGRGFELGGRQHPASPVRRGGRRLFQTLKWENAKKMLFLLVGGTDDSKRLVGGRSGILRGRMKGSSGVRVVRLGPELPANAEAATRVPTCCRGVKRTVLGTGKLVTRMLGANPKPDKKWGRPNRSPGTGREATRAASVALSHGAPRPGGRVLAEEARAAGK